MKLFKKYHLILAVALFPFLAQAGPRDLNPILLSTSGVSEIQENGAETDCHASGDDGNKLNCLDLQTVTDPETTNSQDTTYGKNFLSSETKIKKILSPIASKFESSANGTVNWIPEWLKDAWEKADVDSDISFNPLEKSFSGGFKLSTPIFYRFRVNPAGYSQRQDKRDIYQLRLSAGFARQNWGVSAVAQLEVAFARLIPLEDKIRLDKIYFLNKFPWTAEKALSFKAGEAARLRITAGIGASTGKDLGVLELPTDNDPHAMISASASENSEFLIEIYRLAQNKVEVRVTGIKAPLMLSGCASLNQFIPIDFTATFFTRWLRPTDIIKPAQFCASSPAPGEYFRVDGKAVVYVFDLDKDKSFIDPVSGQVITVQEVYNRFMKPISFIKVFKILNTLFNYKEAGNSLLEIIKDENTLAAQDKDLPTNDRRIWRKFQGETRSDPSSRSFISRWFSRVFQFERSSLSSDTNVFSYDDDNKRNEYKFAVSNFYQNWGALWSIFGVQETRLINGLFMAQPTPENRYILKPTMVSDIVFFRDFRDKNLGPQEVIRLKDHFRYSHPTIADRIRWGSFDNGKKKRTALINYQYVFHKEGLANLARLNDRELYFRLRQWVEHHPHPDMLATSLTTIVKNDLDHNPQTIVVLSDEFRPVKSSSGLIAGANTLDLKGVRYNDRFENDIRAIAVHLGEILKLRDESTDQKKSINSVIRYENFQILSKLVLFQDLGPGFLMSLLKIHKIKDLEDYVYFSILLAGSGESVPPSYFGLVPPTGLYTTLQGQLLYLQNRDFDINLRRKAYQEEIFPGVLPVSSK